MSVSITTKRIKEIRRKTHCKFSSEEKIRIVLEGLRGEGTIAELCRREGINSNLYCRWSKDFLEAGKRRLAGVGVQRLNPPISIPNPMSMPPKSGTSLKVQWANPVLWQPVYRS
jgi:transposase-like protein